MIVRIGLTRPDRTKNYVPQIDGFVPGAKCDFYTIDSKNVSDKTVDEIAEAVFEATNAPSIPVEDLFMAEVREVFEMASRFYDPMSDIELRALSVGDTVEVVGLGARACDHVGWVEIPAE